MQVINVIALCCIRPFNSLVGQKQEGYLSWNNSAPYCSIPKAQFFKTVGLLIHCMVKWWNYYQVYDIYVNSLMNEICLFQIKNLVLRSLPRVPMSKCGINLISYAKQTSCLKLCTYKHTKHLPVFWHVFLYPEFSVHLPVVARSDAWVTSPSRRGLRALLPV